MFSSVFKKLLFTYLVIIVTVIAVLSLILSRIYSNNVFIEKQDNLVEASVKANQLTEEFDHGTIDKESLNSGLDALGYANGAKIYVVRLGKDFLSSSDVSRVGEELKDNYLVEDLRKILGGETVNRRNQYSKLFNMDVVFTGVPWMSGGDVKGAILLFSPMDSIADDITEINVAIWLTGFVFMVISAVVIYLSSLRISKPIKHIQQAASKIAAGETAEDVKVGSRDEIGKLAEAFNDMKKQIADTENMRREFIANVSHDLRTPLTSINGFIEGMRDGLIQPENYGKYLDTMHGETERLIRLTNDVLQLAKLQAGSMQLNRQALSALDILSETAAMIQPIAQEKHIQLDIACDKTTQIFADKDRLQQIVTNIIGNSIRYGKEGGRVEVMVSDLHKSTRVAVKDDGIGIPAADLPFVFEKFYRVEKSRQSSQGSTGLGLNIVKNLVELHGGAIWAESEAGKGTIITFDLPKA